MSVATTHLAHETAHQPSAHAQLRNNRLGLWLFFISEAFLFAGLLIARFYLWGNTRPALDQTLGLIVTVVLLISSFFMNRAEVAIKHDDRPEFMRNLLITAALGIAFLVGVVGFEWQGHIRPTDGAFGAVLYGMTGMHALHVLSGVIFILVVWNLGRQGHYSSESNWGVEACAIWWHYVDLVWVFFYPALYLMGIVVHGG
ncbi:MAG: Cytochrome c oxidase subunit 3 [Anaerolineae bacterium]|nr:Cytochrome c oxidase subunit 3 [Anaerolineae bacterium]